MVGSSVLGEFTLKHRAGPELSAFRADLYTDF
jgi:hypothetical protein